tara:strand:- start:91 stop:1083 length:993 start_codon:yes stop_codon:yes gene_type:complete
VPDQIKKRNSESKIIRLKVSEEDSLQRLDQWLNKKIKTFTRSRLQRLIREGRVLIGSKLGRPSTSTKTGDIITLTVPPPAEAEPSPEAITLDIVHDDQDLIVVNKPSGMVVHPAAGHESGTLVNALLHHLDDLSGIGGVLRPGIVHRLDRGTSGLIVIAKNDKAHIKLTEQFKKRETEKIYIALVWGNVNAGQKIDVPIGRDLTNRKKISPHSKHTRTAITQIIDAEHFSDTSLLRIAILTGRTHQIRVHLKTIGNPIVGDAEYGGIRKNLPKHLRFFRTLRRPFLHAAQLGFKHPIDGKQMTLTSDLPSELQNILDFLRHEQKRGTADD